MSAAAAGEIEAKQTAFGSLFFGESQEVKDDTSYDEADAGSKRRFFL